MSATGIGYAGIEGAWWLPATKPFVLPVSAHLELERIAAATFALFDIVTHGYTGESELWSALNHKVPAHLRRYVSQQRVLCVRPDFQWVPGSASGSIQRAGYTFAATELEICPSAQGYAHAMQTGYELDPDLVKAFAQVLAGRTLIIVMTGEWSEFIWEQLAFCRALEGHGARGRVWLDIPIEALNDFVRHAARWQPPMFGVTEKTAAWNDDVLSRIEDFGGMLLRDLPMSGDNLALFRFGYLDCFSPNVLERLVALEATGALALNPLHFAFDSKAVMTLPNDSAYLARLGHSHAGHLRHALPRTLVLDDHQLDSVVGAKDAWVLKFAGFDHGQQAWGGRSLQVGKRMSHAEWRDVVQRYNDLPFPVVAQQATPTAKLDIAYFDPSGAVSTLHGDARIRSFFVRDADGSKVRVCGTHLTTSFGGQGVSEGTGAVQAPVIFG